jgi:hypothetical protein
MDSSFRNANWNSLLDNLALGGGGGLSGWRASGLIESNERAVFVSVYLFLFIRRLDGAAQ